MSKTTGIAIAVTASICMFFGLARAQEDSGTQTGLQKVALFKNGMGFYTVRAKLPGHEGKVRVNPLLAPAHGTFWVTYPKNVQLQNLIAREVTEKHSVKAVTVGEMLRGNVGEKVKVHVGGESPRTLSGTLVAAPSGRKPSQPGPYQLGGERSDDRGHYRRHRRRHRDYREGELLLLRTDDGRVAVNPQRVRSADFLSGEPSMTFSRKKKHFQLTAEVEKADADAEMEVTYLAKGMTWAPGYRIDLTGEDKASFSARALIINDAAALQEAKVQLITGFPHLRYGDVVSPMAMKESLSQFLKSLREGESEGEEGRGRHAAVAQQSAEFRRAERGRDRENLPSYGAAGAGRKTEDLFLYPVEDVSLDKGERGYYPLFSAQVPFEHVYQWQIPDYVNEENYHRTHRDEEKPETEIVWHSVRLDNTTETPWTTAPAETIRKGQILGQDMLAYTPPGGQQTVRITKAVSVDVNERELEVEREREAKTLYHDEFDRVTIEGRLKASNLKNKKITLEITKKTSAEKIKSTSGDPKMKTLARGLRNLNPKRELKWRITLKPEESRKLTYRYTVLVEY